MDKSIILGTGAGELFPNPFCGCPVCQQARKDGYTRLRSAMLLDDRTMIDFGPDVCAASQHYNAPLYNVRHVLVTHTHEDHFASTTLSVLGMTQMEEPIHFYMSAPALKWVEDAMEAVKAEDGSVGGICKFLLKQNKICLHKVEPLVPFEIEGKTVTPLITIHNGYGEKEKGLNYLIQWERGNWLYAADTGLYGQQNMDYLQQWAKEHGPLDVVVAECTYGSIEMPEFCGHLSGNLLCTFIDRFRNIGVTDNHTQVYITHINPMQTFSHAQLQTYLDENVKAKAFVGYDGMRI
jgi:phosphoribosyl 1,2-cyclic phosphate phosphodiesterase